MLTTRASMGNIRILVAQIIWAMEENVLRLIGQATVFIMVVTIMMNLALIAIMDAQADTVTRRRLQPLPLQQQPQRQPPQQQFLQVVIA